MGFRAQLYDYLPGEPWEDRPLPHLSLSPDLRMGMTLVTRLCIPLLTTASLEEAQNRNSYDNQKLCSKNLTYHLVLRSNLCPSHVLGL